MSQVSDRHMMVNYMRGVYKVLEEDWQKSAKALGLTQAELHILWIVSFEEDITISKIAYYGLWDVSTVMQVIKRLKEKGLVELEKKNDDRRISYVYLTEKGWEKQKESADFNCQVYGFLQKWLEDGDRREFYRELVQLHKDLNKHFHGEDFVDWVEDTGKRLHKANA
ncbi:MarR family transcriptional regulator [Fictibacillus barbaricus]|uniref:MarR family protease production transcriptional regulator HPr n=1 Tax=Fictibacillus barbaricus TaxID=182136 RepID=A0ABU1TZQ0_9BACL|nr:MarR family transcriptional regulator [Fictibacillus barbaricus]MDR7072650.1 MarR family protease production transcriptional regulator HPr [Fictibacillus barbaricus]